MEADR